MLKLVHCGDLHIGAPFAGLSPEQRSIRKSEVLASFAKIIDFCNEKAADALLICGDLFDSPAPKKSDIAAVLGTLEKLADTHVYIIAGNHDPLVSGSVYENDGFLKDYIHIFPAGGAVYENDKLNAAFFGVSYSGVCAPKGISLPKAKEGMHNILLLHDDLSGKSDYSSFSKEDIKESGFDYAALGHIHRTQIFKCGSTQSAYCGTPEPHGFDDDKDIGFIYCEADYNTCICKHICLCARRYVYTNIDVTPMCSNDEVLEKIRLNLSKENLYRIALSGTLRDFELSVSYILKNIEGEAFYVSLKNETVPDYDIEKIMEEPGFRGIFLQRLRASVPDDKAFLKAARMGLCALENREELLRGEL